MNKKVRISIVVAVIPLSILVSYNINVGNSNLWFIAMVNFFVSFGMLDFILGIYQYFEFKRFSKKDTDPIRFLKIQKEDDNFNIGDSVQIFNYLINKWSEVYKIYKINSPNDRDFIGYASNRKYWMRSLDGKRELALYSECGMRKI